MVIISEFIVGILSVLSQSGYQAIFAKLASSGNVEHDPFSSIPDAKHFLAQQIYTLASQMPGQITSLIPAEAAPHLQSYLAVCTKIFVAPLLGI